MGISCTDVQEHMQFSFRGLGVLGFSNGLGA